MKHRSLLSLETASRAVAHDKSKKNNSNVVLSDIQAKIEVDQPGDKYEKEADQVADTMLSMRETQVSRNVTEDEEKLQTKPLSARINPLIQRQPEEEEAVRTKQIQPQAEDEEEPIQAKLIQKRPEDEEEPIQTRLVSKKREFLTSDNTNWLENQLESSKGSGSSLPDNTKTSLENSFGFNFSRVKIHTDADAVQMNKQLHAHAFTHGSDIYFNNEKYSPESFSGKHLLAHELTHVVQQSSGLSHKKRVESKPGISDIHNFIQMQSWKRKASPLIPALNKFTVDGILDSIEMAKSSGLRQELIDAIVLDREGKGDDFGIMEGGKPKYLESYPEWVPESERASNGITLHPNQKEVCTGNKACSFIGPSAFGGYDKDERIVRLYTAIMHEYRHAKQWTQPDISRSLGKSGRETDAFFLDIENCDSNGLSNQLKPFKDSWEETKTHWKNFKLTSEWTLLDKSMKQQFEDRYSKVVEKVRQVLKLKPNDKL